MLTIYDDVALFKKEVIPFLEKHEVENNLALGVLHSLEKAPTLMATVKRDEELLLVLLQTHPLQIILSKPESVTEEEIKIIAIQLCSEIREIPGFIGEKDFTMKLTQHISDLSGSQFHVQMNQRIYKLEQVKKEAGQEGRLRMIRLKDSSLINEWVFQFCKDIGEDISRDEAEEKTAELIGRGRLYCWEVEGKLVSMVNASRPSKSNITINYVFTPNDERKKGYASSGVSAYTQLLLNEGYKTTALYTDLDNPTSNKIYMEIGYEPVMDSILVRVDH
ncbi:GNAT family N-acetyltransferase [Lederbergia citrea]|uniref:GNAT family N-acetyltransferase n=1 Tax=Lederbergia citrea TaxID=2833581 RepID=A0A942UMR2_9BACI|nr:GNAT family N-acetyltransferase [Lederbergia citrea]MBS4177951.1 GNAT family N-acetyltransferase [Lederbergia citrea]MBS4204618.1 GNAT family N-acetyltransferase [Lederbergia citrea]MBS4223535.1 GNAT family N-acetyltransferase [Lederbergia citrea]